MLRIFGIALAAVAAIGAIVVVLGRLPDSESARLSPRSKAFLSFDSARAMLDQHGWPAEFLGKTAREREALWPEWIAQHDRDIRARVARGDEDTLVNLWFFGTSFTGRPRMVAAEVPVPAGRGRDDVMADVLDGRLSDLLEALGAPGDDPRLTFARDLLLRQRIDLAAGGGVAAAQQYLIALAQRSAGENAAFSARLGEAGTDSAAARAQVQATLFRERGLSTDSSFLVAYSIDEAIAGLVAGGQLAPGRVRRVAVIGPGLDFIDKSAGYDFYPPQTLQPLLLADSLVAHGAAPLENLRIVTFDLSERVNAHLSSARIRAAAGQPYVIHLPLTLDAGGQRRPEPVSAYWRRAGNRIGQEMPVAVPPRFAPHVGVRALSVRPEVAAAVEPRDLDIVTERLERSDEAFDLVIATNVLVYYGELEQAFAVANIARMLAPGGLLLSNYALRAGSAVEPALATPSFWTARRDEGDTVYAYRHP